MPASAPNKDGELLYRLRRFDKVRQTKEALSVATGITDEAVLEGFIALNMDTTTLRALWVAPLAAVAWADGSVTDSERSMARACAGNMGLSKNGLSRPLFEQWLAKRPPHEILVLWKAYVQAVLSTQNNEDKRAIKQEVLSQARAVARATGGLLGIAAKIPPQEERMLKELDQALSW